VEQGTCGRYPVDLVADRLELLGRRDNLGIDHPCRVGDCRPGRSVAPSLNRRFCWIGCGRALVANHLQRVDQLLIVRRLSFGLLLDPTQE
jgi:hypothetical protein